MTSLSCIEVKIRSQHGEDGIIEYLQGLIKHDSTFVEIGCGTGKENNTSYLAERGWTGVVFDSKPVRIEQYKERGYPVEAHCIKAGPATIDEIFSLIPKEPAVFSLDIDSIDYWVFRSLYKKGFRPHIMVLEYNSIFGDESITITLPRPKRTNKRIYFGCSLNGWKNYLKDYQFVTVDSSGTNAFFIRGVEQSQLSKIKWLNSVEKPEDKEKWEQIKDLPFVTI